MFLSLYHVAFALLAALVGLQAPARSARAFPIQKSE